MKNFTNLFTILEIAFLQENIELSGSKVEVYNFSWSFHKVILHLLI